MDSSPQEFQSESVFSSEKFNEPDEKKQPNGSENFRQKREEEGDEQEMRGGRLAETIKKMLTAGIGAAFMTEESIRNYLGEVRLPKDVLHLIIQSAGKSKEELLNRVGNEVVKMMSKIDFVREASRFVEEHKFRISAEVEVIKKEKSADK